LCGSAASRHSARFMQVPTRVLRYSGRIQKVGKKAAAMI
jgi:hypothetical protein